MIEEKKEQRRQEDADFDLYGRTLMDRWRILGLVHSHRTRAARRKAIRIGKWLCEPKTLAWLEKFGVAVDDFLDVTYTRKLQDGTPVYGSDYSTLMCGRLTPRPYTWQVWVDEPFPGSNLLKT